VADTSKATEVDTAPIVHALLSAAAVRERCHWCLEAAHSNALTHFQLNSDALNACAEFVAEETRTNYPDLNVPFHSRWRHFETSKGDLAREVLGTPIFNDLDYCRSALDLAIISVLLDAGAGDQWHFHDQTTATQYARSEGLAVASLRMFAEGLFSSDKQRPHRADGTALRKLDTNLVGAALQVTADNPLPGLSDRVALLNSLGSVLSTNEVSSRAYRPADLILSAISGDEILAAELLTHVLSHLNEIWPHGLHYNNTPLGDVGRHPVADSSQHGTGLIPFHKLSQWLVYSLLEPLSWAGIKVVQLDGLTGLAEYRNGGLFIDSGVITPIDPALGAQILTPDAQPIVEWRALTVALLDELAPLVRACLGLQSTTFPLARILQGGTWSAGRRLAQQHRPDGTPPLNIKLTGTLF